MKDIKEVALDDPGIYRQYDAENMLVHLQNFPRLSRQAWQMAQDFELPLAYSNINKVVILGMGGSAIGGDLVSGLAAGDAGIPILICRDYDLPMYVDAGTLVIASSYSGQTEETLSAFEQSLDTPAKKLAITTGGKLKDLCEQESIPYLRFDYRTQPRAALPFSFFILQGLLQKMGVLRDRSAAVAETFENLQNLVPKIDVQSPSAANPAKSLATKLAGRLPVIYGAGITTEVAHRWKTQINENSKSMAFYEYFSELNHNSVVGYSYPEEMVRQAMVVILYSDLLHERLRLRYQITRELLDQAGIYYQVLNGEGDGAMSQMMTLVLFGDYVSYYLAMLNQVDPTPVRPIDYLKNRLAQI